MISGIVTDRNAIVTLTFLLVNGATFPIEFVVDTGFTDRICLPPEAVNLLRLPFLYNLSANLADNSSVSLAVHQATIFWDGVERDVRVLATGRRPLIGTALLNEQELVIQLTEGGFVTIDEL
ncbi:clan AA aspartic protease [Microcoleus sp. CAWBG58]|uniref:clan AA aspartic protease n=1 Tax=Microcoleus sp. CAWBG58 TaxID=2841651 RepID=UPI0025F9E883|nr:clan AA aspartic protease [Microcoleus sp. CAWBG58]